MSTPEPKDAFGAKFGMWLFLFTELILFSGLFILYAVYLAKYPKEFASAGQQLSVPFGAVNTLVLLTSSLFVAMATTSIQRGQKKLTEWLLAGTAFSAVIFMVNKYFEWSAKFHHGIYPDAPGLKELPQGEQIFYGLYFATTGLHGLHVLIGLALFLYVWGTVRSEKVHAEDYGLLENSGLYWHLVDLIWIFIFPLYYLVL